MARHMRSPRNLLLDPRFQLKYALLMAVVVAAVFGAMTWRLYGQVQTNTRLTALEPAASAAPKVTIHRESLLPEGPGDAGAAAVEVALQERLAAQDTRLLMTMAGWCAALSGIVFLLGLLITHRMVGPVKVARRMLAALGRGEALPARTPRRGDEFQSLFEAVNVLAEKLRDRGAEERAAIEASLARLEGNTDPETLAAVRDLLTRR